MNKRLWIVTVIFGLAACAGQPPVYEPAVNEDQTGYSSAEIGPGKHIVGYTAKRGTSNEEIESLALRRAAELTLLDFQDWFRIVDVTEVTETWEDRRSTAIVGELKPLNFRRILSPQGRMYLTPGDVTRLSGSATREPGNSALLQVASRQYKIAIETGSGPMPEDGESHLALELLEKQKAQELAKSMPGQSEG